MRYLAVFFLCGCFLSHRVEEESVEESVECTGFYPQCLYLDPLGCCAGPDTFPNCDEETETWQCPDGSEQIELCPPC